VCTSGIFLSVDWEWEKSYPEDHNLMGSWVTVFIVCMKHYLDGHESSGMPVDFM
jgi:hypothetical protein